MVNQNRKNPNRSSSTKGGHSSSSTTKSTTMKDHIILTTETNEQMEDRFKGFMMLCFAMNVPVDRQCFEVGTRGLLGCGHYTTKMPRKAFNCSDAMYLMLQQTMESYEQENNRMQVVKTIYHSLFFMGWSYVFVPYMTSTVPLSMSPTKFTAQVILILLCLSYMEGWALHGTLSKIHLWDVLRTTYRLCFLYIFVSEISYAHHLNGLPLVMVSWSFTQSVAHAHGLLTSYALSPLLNNKWYQVKAFRLSEIIQYSITKSIL